MFMKTWHDDDEDMRGQLYHPGVDGHLGEAPAGAPDQRVGLITEECLSHAARRDAKEMAAAQRPHTLLLRPVHHAEHFQQGLQACSHHSKARAVWEVGCEDQGQSKRGQTPSSQSGAQREQSTTNSTSVVWALQRYKHTSGGRLHSTWAGNQKVWGVVLCSVSCFVTDIFCGKMEISEDDFNICISTVASLLNRFIFVEGHWCPDRTFKLDFQPATGKFTSSLQ